jgi:hypothetical protein
MLVVATDILLVSGRFDVDLWAPVLVPGGSLFLVYQNTFMLKEWNGFVNWIFFMVDL